MAQIDMHAHVTPFEFPPANGRQPWPVVEAADNDRVMTLGEARSANAELSYNRERRLQNMAEHEVDAEVISPPPPLLVYSMPGEVGRDFCRVVNEAVLEFCHAEPRRFFGLGIVPLQDPDMAARDLSDLKQAGLLGVEVASNINGRSIADAAYLGFFQECQRLDLPVLVHAVSPVVGGHLPGRASGSFGFAAEIGLAAAGLLTGGTMEACPGLRVALSHGGGGFPLMLTRAQYFWGRTWNEEPPAEGAGQGPSPVETARRFYFDALVFDHRALRYMLEILGPKQLMLGSDFPAMPREKPAGKTLRSMELPAGALEDITWNNAFRWLGISPPQA